MVDGMRDAVADRVGGSVPVLLTPYGGPEALFRLGRIAVDDTGASAATMAVGPWLVVDGRPAAGSLGVLMDDVLGQAVIVGRPEFGNPGGVVHGGVLTWVAELASRWLVEPSALHTASIRTAYVRPAIAPVAVAARIVHGGRSFTVIEAVARARDGRPCTLATVTMRAASLC
jgi:uncharacterized protein (TIGR00369 family)